MSFKLEINAAECSVMELNALSALFKQLANPDAVIEVEPEDEGSVFDSISTPTESPKGETLGQMLERQDREKETPVAIDTNETDAAGFPWDARIHSSAKSTNKDGTWKLKRGVDKALVDEIRASFTGAPATTQPDPQPETQPDPQNVGFGQANQSEPAPTNTASAPLTWPEVLSRVTKAKAAGHVTATDVDAAHKALGVDSFVLLANRTDLHEPFLLSLGLA